MYNSCSRHVIYILITFTVGKYTCTLDGIAQEHVAKLLGVFFSDMLSFEDHVNFLLTVCSQHIYLMKLLRSQS